MYTEIVPDARKTTLQAIIRGDVEIDSVIHSDGWGGYHGLVDILEFIMARMNLSEVNRISTALSPFGVMLR